MSNCLEFSEVDGNREMRYVGFLLDISAGAWA